MGTSIKYVCSEEKKVGQGKSVHLLFLWRHYIVSKRTRELQILTRLFQCCFLNVDEYMLTELSFSTKYQHWNNIGSSTLNRRNSFNVASLLFCQRWNNVDKHMSAQLSFSTKFQRWNNVGSTTLNQPNSINVVSTSFCQRWNNVGKCTLVQLSFSTKHQRWCVCWETILMSIFLKFPNSLVISSWSLYIKQWQIE